MARVRHGNKAPPAKTGGGARRPFTGDDMAKNAAAAKSSKPKYETDEQRKERHQSAIDAALAAAPSSITPRERSRLEREAVEKSGGIAHLRIDDGE